MSVIHLPVTVQEASLVFLVEICTISSMAPEKGGKSFSAPELQLEMFFPI